ncbi:hypothetical protein Cabys_1906 [Caldithrix abyssi DSM 13497]|uniref:Uncharacterized protein n=1 Tax=Caldithrix abyssi DSM 13497 TaxID=880073 RepID=A0A1J1C7N7_CALAY|nr:hypothetical protein Cabys_1906 [Caldithrix abyssi DSM 13497]
MLNRLPILQQMEHRNILKKTEWQKKRASQKFLNLPKKLD